MDAAVGQVHPRQGLTHDGDWDRAEMDRVEEQATVTASPFRGSVHLVGVSMPRSGHHLAARLPQALFRDELFYFEYYSEPRCCQEVPCAQRGTRTVTYQKRHDFELDIPTDLIDSIYVIQHRAPVPLLLSTREPYARLQYNGPYGDTIGSNRGEYEGWLGRQAEYYAAFCNRWLRTPPANSVVVDYDELASRPACFLERVLEAAGIEAAPSRIDDAVFSTIERAGRYGEHAFVARSVETSEYVDRDLLAVCESLLYAQELALTARRMFDDVPFEGTLMWQVFLARRQWRAGDVLGALALIDAAIASFPENGLLLHERAILLQWLHRFPEARDALQIASNLLPPHPTILATDVDVALSLGDVAAARNAAEALVALNPNEPVDRVTLALSRSHPDPECERGSCAEHVRRLEDDLIEREIGRRRGQGEFRDAAARMSELTQAVQDHLRVAEQASAEACRIRAEYGRLSEQLSDKEREIADLIATLEARLAVIVEQARTVEEKEQEIADLIMTANERLCLVEEQGRAIEEKERLIDVQARAMEEKERLIEEQALAVEEKERLIDEQARSVEEKELEIIRLAATADERLQLIEVLNADAGQLRAALERLTGDAYSDNHVTQDSSSSLCAR